MTFLIISDYSFVNGGCAKVAINHARGLAEKGHNVVFFAGCGDNDSSLTHPLIKVINLNMPDLLSGNRFKMFFKGIVNRNAEKMLLRTIDDMPSDTIIHVHSWIKVLSPSIFKVFKKKKRHFYLTAHDYFLICPNGAFYNYKKGVICDSICRKKCFFCNCDSRNYAIKVWRFLRFKIQQSYLRNLDYSLFTLSCLMKEQFDKSGFPSKILRNPIDLNHNLALIKQNDRGSYFAYIGRISQEKGVDLFCKALAVSKQTGIVIGDGPFLSKLKEEYKNYSNIEFLGWLPKEKITNYVQDMIALVFPSTWYEGAPLTIPELGSFGVPSIVSDCCSGVDYISANTGTCFKSSSVEDLTNKMILFSNKPLDPNKVYEETIQLNDTIDSFISNYEVEVLKDGNV